VRSSAVQFWSRWVLANAAGELAGLGVAALAAYGLVAALGEPAGVVAVVAFALVMLVLGTFEGVLVGWAQWLVLRKELPALAPRAWIGFTALGAFTAWLLGMIPSTVIQLVGMDEGGAPPDLGAGERLAAAAVLGALLGLVLAVPQWWVLKQFLARAHWWVPANAAAWALGMPLIFAAAGGVPESAPALVIAVTVLAAIALAGAVVGAVHGAVLVWLLRVAAGFRIGDRPKS
jgi:hypothetical protein